VPVVCVIVALNLPFAGTVVAGILTTGAGCVPLMVASSVFIWFVPSTAMYVRIMTVSSEAMFCRLICPSTM